jgi:hypothetical protein
VDQRAVDRKNKKMTPAISKTLILFLLFGAVVAAQAGYDTRAVTLPPGTASAVSPEFVRLVDMGWHSTVGSFLWIPTMPEVLGIYFQGSTRYLTDLAYTNAVDPKLSYPYAFSVITLPAIQRLPNRDQVALAIGQQGVNQGDPDWRVPYYMAADYYLDLKDTQSALRYYDIAAHTPGIPVYAARFSLNFGALPDDRTRTKALWASIYETTNDESLKQRALAYIARLNIFDYLEAAVRSYKAKYGTLPGSPGDLVARGIIQEVPQDPLGFMFKIEDDGTVGIDLTQLPSYLQSAPKQ